MPFQKGHKINLGKKRSEETRIKMGLAKIGDKNPMKRIDVRRKSSESHKGKKLSESHKEKIGNSLKGEKNPNFGKKMSENQKKKISEASKGRKHTEEAKKKIGEAKKGEKNHNYGKHWKDSEETKINKSEAQKGRKQTEETKKKLSKLKEGKPLICLRRENNSNWKGGITPINAKIRNSIEMKLWHKSVLQRDNFTCQKYEIRGGELVAHHINNFADFPELRFAIDNGITLSKKAHQEFHKKYGKKNNTREQLQEFLNDKIN